MDHKIIHIPQTESTNLSLQLLANTENLPNQSMVWTDFQTKGRGQAGSSWESEPGMNLLCSILLYPTLLPANRSFTILEIAALCVKHTLDRYVSDISIKWPNDIYYQQQKISGILIENDIAAGRIIRSIIGIGINLNQQEFKSETPNPISLAMITGQTCDRKVILNQLHKEFMALTDELETGKFDILHQQYNASLYHRNGFYSYRDAAGIFEARIHSVEPSGHLNLERRDGTLSQYGFKEVQNVKN